MGAIGSAFRGSRHDMLIGAGSLGETVSLSNACIYQPTILVKGPKGVSWIMKSIENLVLRSVTIGYAGGRQLELHVHRYAV